MVGLHRGDGDPYLVPDHTLWGDGELAVECYGVGTLELVPIADPGQVLASIRIRLIPPFEQTPALVVAGLGKPGMGARLYAMKPVVSPPTDSKSLYFEADMARAFTPWRIWIERRGGEVSWQVWGGPPQAGKVAIPGPTALLFRPGPGVGLGITRFRSRVVVAKDSGVRDSLIKMPLGEYHFIDPGPPRSHLQAGLSGVAPFVLTEGVRSTMTVLSGTELKPGQRLWAIDPRERRPWPIRRWLWRDGARKQEVEIDEAVPPRDKHVHPGFAVQIVGSVRPGLGVDARIMAYEATCQPPQMGEYLLVQKLQREEGLCIVCSLLPEPPPRLVVVPARRGWDPAIWCRGLQDAAVRGRPADHDLVSVLRAMSTDWDPDSLWQPPRGVRPAADGSPKVVIPVIVDQPEKPDAP